MEKASYVRKMWRFSRAMILVASTVAVLIAVSLLSKTNEGALVIIIFTTAFVGFCGALLWVSSLIRDRIINNLARDD